MPRESLYPCAKASMVIPPSAGGGRRESMKRRLFLATLLTSIITYAACTGGDVTTATRTPTPTPSSTAAATLAPTPASVPNPSPTATPTLSPTATATATARPTPTPESAPTSTPTLTPTPTTVPEPFGLIFLRQDPPERLRGWRDDLIPYVFLVMGFDLAPMSIDLVTAYKGPGIGWVHPFSGQELITYVHPSVDSDTYNVALRLPDGQRAEATLQHVATKPLPLLSPGESYDFPEDLAPILAQLPVVDNLRLYVQPDGCPSERYPPGWWALLGQECENTGGSLQLNAANYVHTAREILLRLSPSEYADQFGGNSIIRTLAHEICHAHQHQMIIEAGLGDPALRPPAPQLLWDETPEGRAFFEATGWKREGPEQYSRAQDEPEGWKIPDWNPTHPAVEDFAEVCAFWYMNREKYVLVHLAATSSRKSGSASGCLSPSTWPSIYDANSGTNCDDTAHSANDICAFR